MRRKDDKDNWLVIILWCMLLTIIGVGFLVYIAEVVCPQRGIY